MSCFRKYEMPYVRDVHLSEIEVISPLAGKVEHLRSFTTFKFHVFTTLIILRSIGWMNYESTDMIETRIKIPRPFKPKCTFNILEK